ncbi:hypothetical protein D9756_007670 [Leucocoprinus leucothites]|uniref:ATP synthase subunit 5, mitochondrial n=1 Tax=Leucocoprinus leucothites TaxID=201217 RepID=A0A8H5FWH8_9AGAR|nr:hypothetical protein D9756_007670 [Leucoagaricus leucothites]
MPARATEREAEEEMMALERAYISSARLRTLLFPGLQLLPPLQGQYTLLPIPGRKPSEPKTILIQQFDIAFFPANQSVSFNISAASVTPGVNVTANLFLNVYGMNPVNFTLDLCSVLGGALCPLPTYNFIGADSIHLPASLGVSDRIPGIAFKIPDLEGFAQLTLTEIDTGATQACIQATLSNGWSTHQPAVEYVTATFALAAFLSALAHSVFPDSLTPFRFLDLFYLYQAIASSAFLNINYPSLYRSFTLNFSWAVGLVGSQSSSLQNSIDNMRAHTGGGMPNSTDSSAVGYVNRRLSPFNYNTNTATSSFPLIRRNSDALGEFFAAISRSKLRVATVESSANFNPYLRTNLALHPAVVGSVPTVNATNALDAGLPIYANSLHIGTANAFMTAFVVSLIVLAIVGAILACGYGVVVAIRRLRTSKGLGEASHFDYFAFVQAWLGLLFLLPLLIFVFYQWTLKDSWVPILLSVITFIGLFIFLIYPPYLILRSVRRSKDPYELYSHSPPTYLTSLGPLYAQYRPERFYAFLALLVVPFLKAIFISFAKSSGFAQVILLLITEFVVLGLQIAFKPHKTRGGDVLSTYLGVTKLVTTGLLIAFVERVAVDAIPRTIIGAVIAVIWSVAVVILLLNLVIYHILLPLWRLATGRMRSNESATAVGSPLNSEGSMLEKGEKVLGSGPDSGSGEHLNVRHHQEDILPPDTGITPAPSWDRITAGRRALNPTPDQNIPLDPETLRAYPISPTESVSTSHDSELPSVHTRDSGTITVGSLLPRRWSFSTGMGSLGPADSLPASPAAYSQQSSRPPSASQYSYNSQPRSASFYSQPSTPSTPADQSEESGGARLRAIREQPSQGSGLDVPQVQPMVVVTSSSSTTEKGTATRSSHGRKDPASPRETEFWVIQRCSVFLSPCPTKMLLTSAARTFSATPGLGRRAASAISSKYSKAVFGAALQKSPQTLSKVATDLSNASAAIQSSPEVAAFITNPTLSSNDRTAGLQQLFTKIEGTGAKKEPISEITKNLFLVLSENGRLTETAEVIEGFNELLAEHKGELTVTVTSTSPLDKATLTRLEGLLKQSQAAQAAKVLKVENKVNPGILGGLIVDFGEKTIDLSVQSRVTKLNNVLQQYPAAFNLRASLPDSDSLTSTGSGIPGWEGSSKAISTLRQQHYFAELQRNGSSNDYILPRSRPLHVPAGSNGGDKEEAVIHKFLELGY